MSFHLGCWDLDIIGAKIEGNKDFAQMLVYFEKTLNLLGELVQLDRVV